MISAHFKDVTGVDAVFRGRDGMTFYVVAREHRAVDMGQLLELEERLQKEMGERVSVTVRAHQGRDPDEMFAGLVRIV